MPKDQRTHSVPPTDTCTISYPALYGRGIVHSTLCTLFWFFPAPVAEHPGAASGPWFAQPPSPWPVPFPPRPPLCASVLDTSRGSVVALVLWSGPTPCTRASRSCSCGGSPCGPGGDGPGRMQGLPGPVHNVSVHARGLRPRQVGPSLAITGWSVLPSACSERVGPRQKRRFRGSIPCLHIPLSTLHWHRYRCQRMTRGQRGWLTLRCRGLAPFNIVPVCPGTPERSR